MLIDLYRLSRFLYRSLEANELHLFQAFLIPKSDRVFLQKWVEFKSWSNSASQLGQEFLPFFYGHELGFFCEVGANDGLRFSNTFFLESMGWNGVLIEPDPRNFKPLIESRSVRILPFCATDDDDIEIAFNLGFEGIKVLPVKTRLGVYIAFIFYKGLFKKIKKLDAEDLL